MLVGIVEVPAKVGYVVQVADLHTIEERLDLAFDKLDVVKHRDPTSGLIAYERRVEMMSGERFM